jgi:hypothetical protein
VLGNLSMTSEEWAAFIASAEQSGEWNENDRAWLRSVLSTDSASRLFGELLERGRALEQEIIKTNLTTEGGRLAAIQMQGKLAGLYLALDIVHDLTEET